MRCDWCGAWLIDGWGRARWDLFTVRRPGDEPRLVFVCYDGCPQPRREAA